MIILLRERVAPDYPDLVPHDALAGRGRPSARAIGWWSRHATTLTYILGVVLVAGLVHGWGMAHYPRWEDDPGTYLSQAWAFAYEGRLSPYTYFYDHTPLGWIQVGIWARLTGGFDRYATAIGFGNEYMLIAKLFSVALIVVLGRRLGFHRPTAAAVGLIFALSPLALTYTRWMYLDNLVTPWLLLAFVLALSPRRSMIAGIGAGVSFAMAALTKETVLLVAPALLWVLWQNSDRRNRHHVLTMSLGCATLVGSLYVIYAWKKDELFPGPGHVSLLGTAQWQLVGREKSGSVLEPGSPANMTFVEWFLLDPFILVLGAVAALIAVLVPKLRPLVLVLVLHSATLVSNGYVPYMHVVNLLPWCALLIGAAAEIILGNGALRPGWRAPSPGVPTQRVEGARVLGLRTQGRGVHHRRAARRRARRGITVRRRQVGIVLVSCLVAGGVGVVAGPWASSLASMTTQSSEPPLAEATQWIGRNAPRSDVVVVHDAIWTDLVHQYGFPQRNVIMAYKLDTDPTVQATLNRIDYIVVPNWYFTVSGGDAKYPTLLEARNHAVPVAQFGQGHEGATVWHVASVWDPRP